MACLVLLLTLLCIFSTCHGMSDGTKELLKEFGENLFQKLDQFNGFPNTDSQAIKVPNKLISSRSRRASEDEQFGEEAVPTTMDPQQIDPNPDADMANNDLTNSLKDQLKPSENNVLPINEVNEILPKQERTIGNLNGPASNELSSNARRHAEQGFVVPQQGVKAVQNGDVPVIPQQGVEVVQNGDLPVVPQQGVQAQNGGVPVVPQQGVQAVQNGDVPVIPWQGVQTIQNGGVPIVPQQGVQGQNSGSPVIPKQGVQSQNAVISQQGVQVTQNGGVQQGVQAVQTGDVPIVPQQQGVQGQNIGVPFAPLQQGVQALNGAVPVESQQRVQVTQNNGVPVVPQQGVLGLNGAVSKPPDGIAQIPEDNSISQEDNKKELIDIHDQFDDQPKSVEGAHHDLPVDRLKEGQPDQSQLGDNYQGAQQGPNQFIPGMLNPDGSRVFLGIGVNVPGQAAVDNNNGAKQNPITKQVSVSYFFTKPLIHNRVDSTFNNIQNEFNQGQDHGKQDDSWYYNQDFEETLSHGLAEKHAGKQMLMSAHHFDISLGALAGAKMSNDELWQKSHHQFLVSKKSETFEPMSMAMFYSWIALATLVVLGVLTLFRHRHRVTGYVYDFHFRHRGGHVEEDRRLLKNAYA